MQWVMKCSRCEKTFEVEVGLLEIFRRGNKKGTKTPCPSCGNSSFNRIMSSQTRAGKDRQF